MGKQSPSRSDPFEREVENALAPDAFISYRDAWDFVSGLEAVAVRLDQIIRTEPARAIRLCETFLACCYEKVDGIDDSSGSFGEFVHELFCRWIKARQAANYG